MKWNNSAENVVDMIHIYYVSILDMIHIYYVSICCCYLSMIVHLSGLLGSLLSSSMKRSPTITAEALFV